MTHPLQRLSADEIRAAKKLFEDRSLLTPTTRFANLALEEPPKRDVLAFQPGDAVDRIRSSHRAAYEVRAGDQPQDRQDPRPDDPTIAAGQGG
jgi:Cu2+-containing amine oxidase